MNKSSMPIPDKIGYHYYIEGEFCERLKHLPDPADEDWTPFETCDLHPAGRDSITVWTQFLDERGRDECDKIAMVIFGWMRGEKDWEGFYADVWRRGDPDIQVGAFTLC